VSGVSQDLAAGVGAMSLPGSRSPHERRVGRSKRYGSQYDIEVRTMRTSADWESAIADADAIVHVGHGGRGFTKDRRGISQQTLWNAYLRRAKLGKPKLEFVILYSCGSISSQSEADIWLWVAELVWGYDGNCYPGLESRNSGGKPWFGPPSREAVRPPNRARGGAFRSSQRSRGATPYG
jgi:hypothetical protein